MIAGFFRLDGGLKDYSRSFVALIPHSVCVNLARHLRLPALIPVGLARVY
jgi:hypothetical protein